jgi:hypothetical protein
MISLMTTNPLGSGVVPVKFTVTWFVAVAMPRESFGTIESVLSPGRKLGREPPNC